MATLFPGQSLLPGQTLQSDNRLYTLTLQPDGNVVLRDSESKPLWRTNTGGGLIHPRDFIMQTDGDLVLYDTSGQQSWASKTQGNPGAFLNMQNDGNLVVYRAGSATETANNALWASRNVPPPLTLKTVVNSGPMLNVGNANLTYLSYDMPFGQDANSGGRSAPDTVPGSWSVPADGAQRADADSRSGRRRLGTKLQIYWIRVGSTKYMISDTVYLDCSGCVTSR